MTDFLRLLTEADKAGALATACSRLRKGDPDPRHFDIPAESFDAVPGKPFAYWVSDAVRNVFVTLRPLEDIERTARQGLTTAEDFRFVRAWWESKSSHWVAFAKGGAFSRFYADVYLLTNWGANGAEIKAGICQRYPYLNGNAEFVAKNPQYYMRPGLTWPRRTQGGLSMRAMPARCIFADKGPAAFLDRNDPEELLALLAVLNSSSFALLVSLQVAFGSYEVGVMQRTPIPALSSATRYTLASLARRAWSLKRTLDTVEETSHAFLLPIVLRSRTDTYDRRAIETELLQIQREINDIAFDLYDFTEADRHAALGQSAGEQAPADDAEDDETEIVEAEAPPADALLSWAGGVVFGRFDWRLATGERKAPPEPDPFSALPAKSPGMLPDESSPFLAHSGILVDDQGHPCDLVRLIEEVLARVDVTVPDDVRRWLQRDFFAFHLQRYSKSRRKAPIYWPLSTTSGNYTLWIYYPSLTSQTLYTAINDFVEPKLKQVSGDVATLRNKGSGRARDDEKQFETLQAFELELIELRDTLLRLAPTYKPNHDDGVQISAAPLWPLFRHKPWQKVLKDTWAKLEKGDYHWAHLAMNYWPESVREKCKTDRSLAIAHGLEELYIEPEVQPKKARGKKKAGGGE
ncbi:type II restriction endonuclease subunit M [Herbaspirillum sp. SJZ107]|uniref:type II restriction endonuclease subunit M n=1 Tax=Herbaspirillum sp. SJZ107 TaxID=2572881 RepID=UPI00114EC798|nr:type II restriction endonuclease subunit M [Herbaspirillum sp. SJZ107]TQK04939.1 hypothetical protein FBX97_3901 [Herbaspirillum sp. SJZ107]